MNWAKAHFFASAGRVRAIVAIALTACAVACGGATGSPAPKTATPAAADVPPPAIAADTDNERGAWRGPSQPQPTSEQIPIDPDDPVWGNPTALVTLVEFSDFQCPFCARAHPTVEQLKREYGPDVLRVVFKHNPLPFHQDALPAAMAAQAVHDAAGPAAFFAYADALFAGQRDLSDANLLQWAADVGVDRAALFRGVREPSTRVHVDRDIDLAKRIGAFGTPAFRINGATLVGAQPIEKFRELIDEEREIARKLRESGTPADLLYAKRVAENYVAPEERPSTPDAPAAAPDTTVYKVPVGKSPTRGPADALVTLVEFSDYECPFCRRAQKTLDELHDRYKGKLRHVFKHNPLPFHKGARPAALFAMEARAQRGDKGFWDATARLFTEKPPYDTESLLQLAKDMKLNAARMKVALEKETHAAHIDADQDLATDLEARGTPAFFINGRKLSGAQPLEKFVALIDEELAKAEALVKEKKIPKTRVYAETIKDGKGPAPPETVSVPAPTKANPSRGPAGAPVVVQVFSDFQCPFCSRVEPTLEQLEKAFPGRVRIVWRNLPLSFHKDARLAAAAALEAFAQQGNKGFWKMHELLFANQATPGGLQRPALEGYARQLGLNAKRFGDALDDGRHEAAIKADEAVADAAGIRGTPGFAINGYKISGAQPLRNFKRAVQFALDDLKKGKRP